MRIITTLCALVCIMSLAAAPASALLAVGVHGGLDLNGQDLHTLAGFEFTDGTSLSLTREEIKSPYMGGVHLLIQLLPVIDVEVGLEASFAKYNISFAHRDSGGGVIEGGNFDEDVTLARTSLYASGKLNMVNLPLIKAYAGAGAGIHFISPLVSRELLEEKIIDEGLTGSSLTPDEILDTGSSVGFHVLGGLRAKPPIFPFAVTFEGRYYLSSENDYGDDTNNFLTVAFGLEFSI